MNSQSFGFARREAIICICLVFGLFLGAVFWDWTASGQVQVQQRVVRPLPPTQYIPSHDYDTTHIALKLHFDWEREQLLGLATITFAPLVKDLRAVEFDAANMSFNTVRLASGAALEYAADTNRQKLRVTLDRAYQPSEIVSLDIDYRTNGPVPRLVGLVGGGLRFIKPTTADPLRPRQIWSQGETEYNHYWFPSYDHPNDFFTTEITATVEKPLTVISNGQLVDLKDNGRGEQTFHWKMEQPHAGYLTSIIVGEFTPIVQDYAGIPVITNVYKHEVAEGKVTAARLAEMVRFFSEKTGLKYPYAKYAQTTVRDFGGGMENISATTQTDNMIHDARTELDQTQDGLQSHELAHQWFGDYVTCRSWSDIWLNESFATYFQAMWDEHHLGHDDFLYLDVKGNQDQYFTAWKNGNRRPIVTKNYATPDSVFDTYAYPRGAAVLHMLRTWLGEENWWRAINHYLTRYAHQPVDTEEFRIAIEESTGQSMDWFFDQWLYRMGHPIFLITKTYDAGAKRLTLTSYAVIRTAAEALGATRSPLAYENLSRLLAVPSWRDTIRISALNGLTVLGDGRGLAPALRFVGAGNSRSVRGAALKLLGATGKNDPRSFGVLTEALEQAVAGGEQQLSTEAAEGLTTLGDVRGLAVIENLLRKSDSLPQIRAILTRSQEKLRSNALAPKSSAAHP